MGHRDSQYAVGDGYTDADKDGPLTTGETDKYGPYEGTYNNEESSSKVFIENSWGSLWEFVDDTQLYSTHNAWDFKARTMWIKTGTNSSTSDITKWFGKKSGDNDNKNVWEIKDSQDSDGDNYGKGCSSSYSCWGMPTGNENDHSTNAPDNVEGMPKVNPLYPNNQQRYALVVGGCYDSGDSAGITAMNGVDSDCDDNDNETRGARMVFLLGSDPKGAVDLTVSKNTGATLSITVNGVTRNNQTTFNVLVGTRMSVDSTTTSTTYGTRLTFTDVSGNYCVINATASDNYRLLGWYHGSSTFKSYTITESTTVTMKTQAVTILTVGTDGGGTLQNKIGSASNTSVSEGQQYLIDKGTDAITISGNSVTFKGCKVASRELTSTSVERTKVYTP